jgi:hypothetical protein
MKKKLLFFLMLSGLIIAGVGCLREGENRSSWISFAVIDYNAEMGGCVMNLPDGVVAAPELDLKLKKNDCITAKFTVDYSNQPSPNYLTAIEIKYELLNNRDIDNQSIIDAFKDHNDSIFSMDLGTNPNYNGNLFVQINRYESNNRLYDYRLIFDPDSVGANGVNTVFLKSKKLDKVLGDASFYDLETFNLQPLFATYGKDTIIKEQNIEQNFRYLSLVFKYQSGLEKGVPVYSRYNTEPVFVYMRFN